LLIKIALEVADLIADLEKGTREGAGSIWLVGDSPDNDDEVEVCMAERVDTPKGKPMTCPFLKLGPRKKEEMCFTFDMSKCNKLFDVLL
jgi:hypothetical protein